MKTLVIDFESYVDNNFSLSKLTIAEYVLDPRCHIHGVATCRPDGRAEFRTDVAAALAELQAEFGVSFEQVVVVCHNAYFDLFILNHRYGIRPRYFIDTMLLSYHVHGRKTAGSGEFASLGALAKRYGLQEKGDLDFMWGVRNPSVQQLAQLTEYAINDARITALLAAPLLAQITCPEVELPILMHAVRMFTEGGIRVDVPAIATLEDEVRQQTEAAIQATSVSAELIAKNNSFNELLSHALARTGRQMPLKQGKNSLIPATAKKDKAMQKLLEDDDDMVAALARARIGIKGQGQKLARLRTLLAIATATGGVLPPYLAYFGAHTGRFAGGGGFNFQNLGREGLGLMIRHLLLAKAGYVFITADYAAIEARVTAWLAGEVDLLEAFRVNRDVYSEFASRTFGGEVRKPRDADPPELQKQLGALRQVGKTAVLGLGFGMGALKFMNTLGADPNTAPLFTRGELTPLICRDIVRAFRTTYPAIAQFWKDLEMAAQRAIAGERTRVGLLTFERDGDVVKVWLPSGRALRYPNMRMEPRQRVIKYLNDAGEEDEFIPEGDSIVYGVDTVLYGGKLCENVVQATARDFLVEAVLQLEASHLPVVFHVHDEVIVEVPQDDAGSAESAKAEVERILNSAPTWAQGFPIKTEAIIRPRYGK